VITIPIGHKSIAQLLLQLNVCGSTQLEKKMNKSSVRVLCGAALTMSLMGCLAHEAPFEMTSNTPAQPGMSLDPSVPDASSVFAAQDAADATLAAKQSVALPKPIVVGKEMTKEQESKAMPMPGQTNDHSTPGPKGN
jgi:hypothetical protein